MSSIDPIKHRDDPALEKSAKIFHQQRRNRPNKRETERSTSRLRHGFWAFRHSALTRRIVIFNLIALNCLIAAALYFSSTRESLVFQRSQAMVVEAELAANIISIQMAHEQAELSALSGLNNMLAQLRLSHGSSLYVFADKGTLIGEIENMNPTEIGNVLFSQPPQTPITDGLSAIWSALKLLNPQSSSAETGSDDQEAQARNLIGPTLLGQTQLIHHQPGKNSSNVTALTPIYQLNAVVGVVALVSPGSQIDALVKSEQERTLQLMLIGTLFSIFLSIILASSISNPLRDLANTAELGREKNAKNVSRGRIRIPDLSDRTDEIGRLSSALRGMVEALYDRIESNEQFAADVAHEIKNPLASLRSAVGTLQRSKREDHRTKLLEVIDHDVRRLDRLVSDISNASRLDSELVKEDQETFD
ncbi:MAG: HAMP domain-containing protein, partial [Rhodobacteraceae bacterium]